MTRIPHLRVRIDIYETTADRVMERIHALPRGLPYWINPPLRAALASPWCDSDQVLRIADALREAAADCPPGSNVAAAFTAAAALVADLAPERAP
jgi:hypothetical protein